MAKKFKKIAVLGCLIAVEEMADFTLWFQQKYDFFGTSSVLTPLIALKNQTNLWKHFSICQCTSQGPKITKFELFEGFLALGMTMINRVNGGEKLTLCCFLFSSHSMASDPNPNVFTPQLHTWGYHKRLQVTYTNHYKQSLWPDLAL